MSTLAKVLAFRRIFHFSIASLTLPRSENLKVSCHE